jgi:hypothetical protein
MDRRPVENERNIALRGINGDIHKKTVHKLCRQVRQHRQYREMENNKLMRWRLSKEEENINFNFPATAFVSWTNMKDSTV